MAKTGLALDLGTTNLAGFIIDLDKPKDHFNSSLPCSLSKHGRDVVTRQTFASNKKNLDTLQKLLVNDINNLIFSLCKKIRINRKRLDRIIVSGNPVMLHFLLGTDISGNIAASTIGIAAGAKTKLITLPCISDYVGGDAVAGILYTKMNETSSLKLLIDLGTNAEIVLGNKDKTFATSAAAGPAFKNKEILLGSKMISKVAGMLRRCEIDRTGKVNGEGIAQEDIRNLQLAKAAIRAGIEILLEKAGKNIEDVKKILIAGLFGEKIDISDAIEIGLVPKVKKTKVRAIGNSSLGGEKMVLLEPGQLEKARQAAASVEHVELSLEAGYQEKFIAEMNF
jgi:uncharacterized 2Fe-2S/4Fe-4S cluster protein (DUF4445 family)